MTTRQKMAFSAVAAVMALSLAPRETFAQG